MSLFSFVLFILLLISVIHLLSCSLPTFDPRTSPLIMHRIIDDFCIPLFPSLLILYTTQRIPQMLEIHYTPPIRQVAILGWTYKHGTSMITRFYGQCEAEYATTFISLIVRLSDRNWGSIHWWSPSSHHCQASGSWLGTWSRDPHMLSHRRSGHPHINIYNSYQVNLM
jgi:hypothetical protein